MKPRKLLAVIFLPMLVISLIAVAQADSYSYEPSYTTYDTTYDAILKMYIRVINGYGRKTSEGRHDLYNEFIMSQFIPE